MKNLRDAPAVVIGFVYMLLSLPTFILYIPVFLQSINGTGTVEIVTNEVSIRDVLKK